MSVLKKSLLAMLVIAPAVGIVAYEMTTKKPESASYVVTTSSGTSVTGTVAPSESADKTAIAYVSSVDGTAEIRTATGMVAASENASVFVGNSVTTGENSNVEIVFSDSSVIRLSEKSTFSIALATGTNTEVTLSGGTLWARILKPLGDASFFTIKTSDLSAGVRGTAVLVKTSGSGTSSVDVIDSYSGTGTSSEPAVMVDYHGGQIGVNPEEAFSLRSGTGAKNRRDMVRDLLSDEFVRSNMKRDILYIRSLENGTTGSGNENRRNDPRFMAKLQGELDQTLPKPDEMGAFFDSNGIKDYMEKAYDGTGSNFSPDEKRQILLNAIRDDSGFLEKKRELERIRRMNFGGSGEQAREFQSRINSLEGDIKGFDSKWQAKLESQLPTVPVPPPTPTEPAPVKPPVNAVSPTPVKTPAPSPTPVPTPVLPTPEPKITVPTVPKTTVPTVPVLSWPAVIR